LRFAQPTAILFFRFERVSRNPNAIIKTSGEREYGAVAQLGERLNGIQEVRGSIPLGSIN
jgi:hypothetical protein